jgi:hypothetical protein
MLTVALLLSAIGGYFSISGLTTIFAGSPTQITILAVILEVAKVSIAGWSHYYWKHLSKLSKIYLPLSVLVLMFITELGIYGYMARAHIDHHTTIATQNSPQIALLDSKIENMTSLKQGIDNQIAQIDKSISQLKGNVALRALAKQRTEKEKLVKQQQVYAGELIKLNQEKVKLSVEQTKLETELGPLKYVAQAIPFIKFDNESVVRFLILMIMFVFDPLAIMLVIATTSVLAKLNEKEKKEIDVKLNGTYPEVDLDKFFKYNSNTTISALDLTKAKL